MVILNHLAEDGFATTEELVGKSSRRACSKFPAPLVRKRWITCGASRDSALLPENYVSKKRKAGQEILSRSA